MTTHKNTVEMSLEPTARSVPFVAGDTPAMREWAEQLVARARAEGVELTGDDGLLTAMIRQVLQTGLEVELADHLGYDPAGRGSGNSRNGSSPKTVTTDIGDVEVRVPRDRNSTFDPQTVSKHQRRLDGLAGNVISLYAKSMTTGDIQAHLFEIYGTEISRETISKITERIVDEMLAWQHRPLDRIYPVLLIDAIVIKVRAEVTSSESPVAAPPQPARRTPTAQLPRTSSVTSTAAGTSSCVAGAGVALVPRRHLF